MNTTMTYQVPFMTSALRIKHRFFLLLLSNHWQICFFKFAPTPQTIQGLYDSVLWRILSSSGGKGWLDILLDSLCYFVHHHKNSEMKRKIVRKTVSLIYQKNLAYIAVKRLLSTESRVIRK